MLYIVDANNVAGKLKMLGQDNFDLKLIEIFKNFNQNKNKEIELVFDGVDMMGDRRAVDDKLSVVYAPKDDFYDSADDKIVEMTERYANRKDKEITVVTDDVGLKKRILKIGERYNKKINLEKATWWAGELTRIDDAIDEKEELENKQINKINQELLKYWE
ncbi:MAG: NYN domain-containing protein [Patescibacteria group bacterium]|nr:NYN domain-containing protein [Patescibacteria group bacterium]